LAFTTIPGASATDATTFNGTEGVDVLSSIDVITALVEGLGSSDTITANTQGLSGFASLTDWTVRGGTGNDTLTIGAVINEGFFVGGDVVGGLFNGNQGGDTIEASRIFGGARILGGMDIDTITVDQVFSSSVNGNKGADTVNVDFGLVNGSVFGGQGADAINVGTGTTDGIESSLISGDFGSDTITVKGTLYGSSTIEGGEGNDTINFNSVVAAAGNDDGLIIIGGIGDDIITAGAPVPATATIANDTNDTISGDEGDDTIAAGGGDDTVTGGAGNDNLVVGGSVTIGGKTIVGAGDGIDVVTGGAGADTFWGKSAEGGTTDAPTWDKITDYVKGVDKLADGTGQTLDYIAYTTETFATVKDLLGATLTIDADLNVAVGSDAAGYSSFIVTTDTAGKVDTIAQLNATGIYTATQAVAVGEEVVA
jgi:Ca2+-binding RTX toxin-like protein